MTNSFEQAIAIADAVMYEGYILYPYRASAMKNQFRWQFGVVSPRESGSDPSSVQTECLIEPASEPSIRVRVRCLQLQRRFVEQKIDGDAWRACGETHVAGQRLVPWDEGVAREIDSGDLAIRDLYESEQRFPFRFDGARETEAFANEAGLAVARLLRERWDVTGYVAIRAEQVGPLIKLRVRIENATDPVVASDAGTDRDAAIRQSLLGCHALLAVENGAFVSLLDPPDEWRLVAESCRNEHTWPVLVGSAGTRSMMLSAPIILYDYPLLAPESGGDYFDATEIDELLALRVSTLTDEERRAAAATDERSAAILARTANQSPADFAQLHGAVRSWTPSVSGDSWEELVNPSGEPTPERASITIGDVRVAAGTRVRLTPRRRADAQDMFLAGRIATIAAIFRDLEDKVHIAVTVDDDPAADLQQSSGRYWYFAPEEMAPLVVEKGDDDP